MGYESKEGSGSLIVNGYKDNDKKPDLVGDIKINGQIYKISGWKSQTANGKERIGLRVDQGWSGAGAKELLNSAFPIETTPSINDDVPF